MTRRPTTISLPSKLEVSGAGIALYRPGDIFGPHHFPCYEFVWIMDGQVEWEVNGFRQKTPPGSLCLMTPGTVQTFYWDTRDQSRHAFFMFSFAQPAPFSLINRPLPLLRKMTSETIYEPLFRHILWLSANGHRHSSQIRTAVHCLWEAFVSGDALAAADVGEYIPQAVVAALRFVRHKWAQGTWSLPSLPELARHAGVSKAQLHRHFMAQFGMGPLTAIRLIRLEEASLRLVRNKGSIKEIAEATGFSSAYHFSKVFKDVSGLCPKEFRKRVHNGQAVRPLPKLVQIRQIKRIILEGD